MYQHKGYSKSVVTPTLLQSTMQNKTQEEMTTCDQIQQAIDDHLIGWWANKEGAVKGHYKVIPENLIDFIEKFIVPILQTPLPPVEGRR